VSGDDGGTHTTKGKPLENMGFRLKSRPMDSLGLIREFLKDRLGVEPDRVTLEAVLAGLGVDSLLMLELVFEFEDRFGVKLPGDLTSPRTVGEMASLMDNLISQR